MGIFSFLTSDTKESIAVASSGLPVRPVYLLEPDGEEPHECASYTGNGMFGGVDCYEWVALNNAKSFDIDLTDMDFDQRRSVGIKLFSEEDCPVPLKLSFDPQAVYEKLPAAERCPDQGMGNAFSALINEPAKLSSNPPASLDFRA